MARPTKLDERTQSLILVGIRLGLTYEDAAQAAGIGKTTFYRWAQAGKQAKRGRFREFWDALMRVRQEAQLTLAKQIHDAAKGGKMLKEKRTTTKADGTVETVEIEREAPSDWRAAALILERRYPDTWGRRDSLKLEVNWRQELESIGVDPDAAFQQTLDILRSLTPSPADSSRSGETNVG